MSTRLFDSLDVINIVEGWDVGDPQAIANSGVVFSTNFGNWQISGNGTGFPPDGSSFFGRYTKAGTIDYTRTPAIPANATITKISVKLGINLDGLCIGNPPNAQTILGALQGLAGFATDVFAFGFVNLPQLTLNNASSVVTDQRSASQAAALVDLVLPYPITYLELLSLYANVFFALDVNILAGGDTSGQTDFTVKFSNFQLQITYTAGPFSWYLQTHTSTIGGKPSVVVDDIVAVDNDTIPPAGSTFYGTGENFPTEGDIPLYYWYDPVSFTILFQPIRPYLGWLLQLVNFVGDSTGALQFDMALESIVVLMTDPSGIYTLVEGQRHDTLYERFVGVPSINVKIPDPFAKTGFIP